jgi:hypothetical protein
VSQSHSHGLYNYARCLEYGKGIGQDFIRAAKYYHLSAELNDADPQNSLGIFFEQGMAVQSNPALAARYYQRAALQGHPDGANNLGFCLEHGRGVERDIQLAANDYKYAADRGHPEGDLNYRRCLRLLGRWDPPDRSSQVTVQPPPDDHLADPFIDCLKEPEALNGASTELIASIERWRTSRSEETKAQVRTAQWNVRSELGRGGMSVARLAHDPEGILSAVKFSATLRGVQQIQRENTIHKRLKHPLILEFRGHIPEGFDPVTATMAEVAENGSLARYLPSAEGIQMCQLRGETRIAKVIVGIVLAMRYIHSMGVIHCGLNRNNILLDLDWNIRIAGFGHSLSPHESVIPNDDWNCSFIESHYLAPECYDSEYVCESGVFSFGLILYELVVGEPAFPKTLSQYGIAKRLIMENKRSIMPAFVLPAVQELIHKCWMRDYWRRPTFNELLDQLEAMNFKLPADVKSSKLSEFVKQIKDGELHGVRF